MVISVKAKVIVYHLGEEEGKGGRGGGIKDFGVTLKHTKIFEIFLRSPPQYYLFGSRLATTDLPSVSFENHVIPTKILHYHPTAPVDKY